MKTAQLWVEDFDRNNHHASTAGQLEVWIASIQADAILHAATLHRNTPPSEHYEHQRELERIIESLTI